MTKQVAVIGAEGADYVRQGENVLHGQGSCGLIGHEELLDAPGDLGG